VKVYIYDEDDNETELTVVNIQVHGSDKPATFYDPPEYAELWWEVVDAAGQPVELSEQDTDRIQQKVWDYVDARAERPY